METLDRMLGATISRLQRNAAIGKRGTHQHDCAMVARQHALQRRHSAVYLTQISDLSHSPVIFGCHVDETPQCARKGGIDPDVDRRSEARRVGKEGVSTCKSRWASYH